MLPDSSEATACSRVVISAFSPRFTRPSCSTPATSVAKRTQRVHWMQRVMIVLISGPMYFSVTARLFRSEEHTSELQSLMRISYAVFCLKKKQKNDKTIRHD